MENVERAELQKKKKKRTRKRKNSQIKPDSSSCISARLDPDFDPVKKVTQPLFAEPTPEETNPKTASFEELVEFLHPTLIYEYLDKILHFLNGPRKYISFPNMAPVEAAFFVRIAKNNANLKSVAFDDKSLKLASEILRVVEKNKNVFEWVHTYQDGNDYKNVFYKKQFLNGAENNQKGASLKLPSTTKSASSVAGMKRPETKGNVSPSFRINFLNTTLKFLKDANQLILEYPEMSLVEGQYAYSLLQYRDENGSVGLGYHTMNASLHIAMKKLEEVYDFEVSFRKSNNFGTTKDYIKWSLHQAVRVVMINLELGTNTYNRAGNDHLKAESISPSQLQTSALKKNFGIIALEKVPKLVKGIKNKRSADLNTSNAPPLAVDPVQLPDNPDMIRLLPESFVRASLEKAAEFYEDEFVASMDFKELITVQARFVKSIPEICEQEHLYELFSPECRKLLTRIKMAGKHNWKLQVNVGKACTSSKTRTITYFKEPVFTKRQPLKSIVVKIDNTTHGQTKSKEPVIARKVATNINTGTKNEQTVDNLRIVINNTQGNTKTKKYIDFKSAGLQTIDTVGVSDVPTSPKTASDVINALSKKRKNVFAGLATPLESNRAERMMRAMGWEGGALGVRGEGITEPIVPALDIKPGAGLGHVKKVEQQKGSQITSAAAAVFRIAFLSKMLFFVTCPEQWTTMPLKPVSKKNMKFVNSAVKAFNERKNLGLNGYEENELSLLIKNFMEENPTILITLQNKEDTKEIYFAKETIDNLNSPVKKNKKKSKTAKNDKNKCDAELNASKVNADFKHDSGVVKNDSDFVKNDSEALKNNPKIVKNDSNIVKNYSEVAKNDSLFVKNDSKIVKNDSKNDSKIVKNESEIVKNDSEVVKIDSIDLKNAISTEISTMSVLELAGVLEDTQTTLKTAKSIAFRVLFMERMCEFLAEKNDLLVIKLDTQLSQKHKRYIDNVILEFNKRKRVLKGHKIENDVYTEIHDMAGDCYMSFVVHELKIVLRKRYYYKKQFSKAELEPPKSKDLKNTIIYEGKIVYKPEDA